MDNSPIMPQTSDADADTKVCPYCAETIKRAAIVCRYCGRDLATPLPIVAQPASPNPVASPAPAQFELESKPKKKGGCGQAIFITFLICVGGLIFIVALGAFLTAIGVVPPASTSQGQEAVSAPTPTTAQIKAQAVSLPYDDLARETEKHIGRIVHYQGTVLQVVEGSGNNADLRIMVTGADVIYVHYEGPRVLENDTVDVYAKVNGRLTYKAIMGNQVTVPELTALILDVIKKEQQ